MGHEVKDCTVIKQAQTAKAYTVKDQPASSKATKGKGVLEGNLIIYDSIVIVLFDTDATHSFISQQAINELNLEPDFDDEPICVKNPVRGPANLCLRCRDVPISYSCYQFLIGLFVLDFNELKSYSEWIG